MRILLDTNVLLNDFFFRNPDFGFQRIQDQQQAAQVEAYRQTVHESLLYLSLQQGIEIWTTTGILARFAAILGDLLVPSETVLEEMQHWLSQIKQAEVHSRDLEKCLVLMEKSEPRMDFDDYLLRQIAQKNELDMILTSVPKSREFFWPVLVFKPEKVKELNFKTVP